MRGAFLAGLFLAHSVRHAASALQQRATGHARRSMRLWHLCAVRE